MCPDVSVHNGPMSREADQEDWRRVGVAVRARRGTRTQEEVAAAAEMSSTVLGEIERGDRDNFTGRTLAKLSTALRWSTDSIDRILAGEEPIEVPNSVPEGVSYRRAEAGNDVLAELRSIRSSLDRTLGQLEVLAERLMRPPA